MAQTVTFVKLAGKYGGIAPLYDKVIVEPNLLESKIIKISASIQARHQATAGRVVAVGPSLQYPEDPPFKVGDLVVFARYAGTDIVLSAVGDDGSDEEKVFLALPFGDILSVVKEVTNA